MKKILRLFRHKNIPIDSEFGQLVVSLRLTQLCVFVLIFLLLFAINKANKPPLIIRYTPSEAIVDSSFKNNTEITTFDIELFVRHFLEKMNLFDSFSLSKNLPIGLNMMSPDLRSYYQSQVIDDDTLKKIINLGTNSDIEIEDTRIENKGEYINVDVVFTRSIMDFTQKKQQNLPLKATLVLEVLPERTTDYPYGIRVKKFKEFSMGNT